MTTPLTPTASAAVTPTPREMEEVAAFIVTACNNHERLEAENAALVSALEKMTRYAEVLQDTLPGSGDARKFVTRDLKFARALIATHKKGAA